MADLTSRCEELIQKIEAAFADVPYPGDENIGIHREGESFIGQTDWRTIPVEFLLDYGSTLLDLKPKAMHFFLPAYMRATLQYREAFHTSDTVIFRLTPYIPASGAKSFVEWAVPLFSTEQKSVVVEFLEFYPILFPFDAYNIFEEDKAALQSAIDFWKNN